MYPPSPPEPPHQQAGRAAMQGFAGCLGVGLAIVFVALCFLGGCALLVHH